MKPDMLAAGYVIAQLPFAGVDYLRAKGQQVGQTVEKRRKAIQPVGELPQTTAAADRFLEENGIVVPESARRVLNEPVRVRAAQMAQRGEVSLAEVQLSFLRKVPQAEQTEQIRELVGQLETTIAEEKQFKEQVREERAHSISQPQPPEVRRFSLKTTIGDTFFQNNLLAELDAATKPRAKGKRVLPPELQVREPDKTVASGAVANL